MQPPFVFALPNHVTGIEALGHLHEAEKKIIADNLWHRYCDVLTEMFLAKGDDRTAFIHGTPRQKCEALYTIINQGDSK